MNNNSPSRTNSTHSASQHSSHSHTLATPITNDISNNIPGDGGTMGPLSIQSIRNNDLTDHVKNIKTVEKNINKIKNIDKIKNKENIKNILTPPHIKQLKPLSTPLITTQRRHYQRSFGDDDQTIRFDPRMRGGLRVNSNRPIEYDITRKSEVALALRSRPKTKVSRPASITKRLRIYKPREKNKRLSKASKKRENERELLRTQGATQRQEDTPDDFDSDGNRKLVDLPGLPLLFPPLGLNSKDAVMLFRREKVWKDAWDSLYNFQTSQPPMLPFTHQIPLCNPREEHLKELLTMIPRCNSIHSVPTIISELIEFSNHFGAIFHPAILPRSNDFSPDNYGTWGIYATQDIPAFTCIMSIPTPLLLQSSMPLFSVRDGIKVDLIGKPFYEILASAGSYGLHLRLFIEFANYFESPYRPYLDTVPKAFPTTPAYKDFGPGSVLGENLSLEVRQHLEELQLLSHRGFEIISNFINNKVPKEWCNGIEYNWEVYQYIETLIFTRGFDIDRRLLHTAGKNRKEYTFDEIENEKEAERNKRIAQQSPNQPTQLPKHRRKGKDSLVDHVTSPTTPVIVPFADLLNHSNAPNVEWFYGEYGLESAQIKPEHPLSLRKPRWSQNAMYFYTKRPVYAGEELTRSYQQAPFDFFNHLPKIKPLSQETSNHYLRAISTPIPTVKLRLPPMSPSNPEYNAQLNPLLRENRHNDQNNEQNGQNGQNTDPNNLNNSLVPIKHTPAPLPVIHVSAHEWNAEYTTILSQYQDKNPLTELSMNKVLKKNLIRFPYLNLGDFSPTQDSFPHLSLFWMHGISSKGHHLPYWTRNVIDPESGVPMMMDERGYFFVKTPFFQDYTNIADIFHFSGEFYKESLHNTNQLNILDHPSYRQQIDRVVEFHLHREQMGYLPMSHLSLERPPTVDPRAPLLFNTKMTEMPDDIASLLVDLLESVNKRANRYDGSNMSIAQQFRQKFGKLSEHKKKFYQKGQKDNYNASGNNPTGSKNGQKIEFDPETGIPLVPTPNALNNADEKFDPEDKTQGDRYNKWSFQDLMESLDGGLNANSHRDFDPELQKESSISKLYPFRFGVNYISPELEAICYLLAAAATNTHIINPGMYHNLLHSIRDVFDPDRLLREKHRIIKEQVAIHKGHTTAREMGYQPGDVPTDKNIDYAALERPDGNIVEQHRQHQNRQYFNKNYQHDGKTTNPDGSGDVMLNNGTIGDVFGPLHRPAYAVLLGIMNVLLLRQNGKIKMGKFGKALTESEQRQYLSKNPKMQYPPTPPQLTSPRLIEFSQPSKVRFGYGLSPNLTQIRNQELLERFVEGKEVLQEHLKGNRVKLPPLHSSGQIYRDMFHPELLEKIVRGRGGAVGNGSGEGYITESQIEDNDLDSRGNNNNNTNDEKNGKNEKNEKNEKNDQLNSNQNNTDNKSKNNDDNENNATTKPRRLVIRPNTRTTSTNDQFKPTTKPLKELYAMLSPQDRVAERFNQHVMKMYYPDERSRTIHNNHDENPFVLTPSQHHLCQEVTRSTIQQFENIPNYTIQHIFNSIATTLRVRNRYWDIDSIIDSRYNMNNLHNNDQSNFINNATIIEGPNNLSNQIKNYNHKSPIGYVPAV